MTDVAYDSARPTKDNIEGMRQYFRVVERGAQREFWCKGCKKGWSLPVGNNHPGNYLHLLNHAYGHYEKK